MAKCQSCDIEHTFYFQYCPVCGAKVVRQRLRFSGLLRDLLEAVTNLDNPVWNTLRDITVRPRVVTHGFISGVRKKYLSPARYLLLAFSVSGLILLLYDGQLGETAFEYQGMLEEMKGELSSSQRDEFERIKAEEMIGWLFNQLEYIFKRYMILLRFLYIPFLALFTHWGLNKRTQYYLAESFVLTTYLFSHTMVVVLPVYLLLLLPDIDYFYFIWISTFLVLPYLIWMMREAYQAALWKSILTVLLSYFIYLVLVGLALYVYLITTYLYAL